MLKRSTLKIKSVEDSTRKETLIYGHSEVINRRERKYIYSENPLHTYSREIKYKK